MLKKLRERRKWRAKAIQEGRVCCDCGQPIALHDLERWLGAGRRCWVCDESRSRGIQRLRIEKRYDREDRISDEDHADGSWKGG